MSNSPFHATTNQQNTLHTLLQTAAQSVRFSEDVTSFILKITKDAQAVDQKITLAKNQLDAALSGCAELATFKDENDKFNSLIMATRMNASKGNAVINDFRSELLPFFTDASVSVEDKLAEFSGYLEQLDACSSETRRIDTEFQELCRNIQNSRVEIAKAVEDMNTEDKKTIAKTQEKLENTNENIRRLESRMSSTVENLRQRFGDIFQQFYHLTASVLYSIIYSTQYTSQTNGRAPSGESNGGILSRVTNLWSGNNSQRYDEYHRSSPRRGADQSERYRSSSNTTSLNPTRTTTVTNSPPPYSASTGADDEARRRAERELGRLYIDHSDLPSQHDMRADIQDLDTFMDSRARYIKRIDDLKTKVALRMSVADVIGDLPQEIRALASDIIKFIDIHPQLKAQCETLRSPIAGGASTRSELQNKVAELSQLLPAFERGLRAYAVARTEADVRTQMSRVL